MRTGSADSNPFFAHDTLAYNDVSPYWVLVTNGSVIHKISSKLTLTETSNLDCDIDLEHNNPIFSLDISSLDDEVMLNVLRCQLTY